MIWISLFNATLWTLIIMLLPAVVTSFIQATAIFLFFSVFSFMLLSFFKGIDDDADL